MGKALRCEMMWNVLGNALLCNCIIMCIRNEDGIC